jgi:hypothetical protein
MPTPLLRLRAEDTEDLTVMAAALQDAAFLMKDVSYDPRERRFLAELNRFRWEEARKRGPYERVRAALSIESVLGVKSRKVRLGQADAAGAVLDLAFTPAAEPPAGAITLKLGGGGEIAIDVECIDVSLTDVGQPWLTTNRPDHERS